MPSKYDATKSSYKHLIAIDRGKIEALYKDGKSQAEIARILGGNHSKIKPRPSTHKRLAGKSIGEQPELIKNRSEFENWEINLMIGKKKKNKTTPPTLVERKSRFVPVRKLAYKSAVLVNQEMEKLVTEHPDLPFKTSQQITVVNFHN
ncbi:Mobile element protein [Streptococcus oralis]|uniref:Mobile element protein n=1 Tax=Streptococcus oralis TaxID=1303 RepID=A0A139RKR1_STROR|nr:helix-turn-helix domain-containing protein [Streptococcus oralis]KXU15342.1 Mobile element protein [Streptococcus oralis]